MKTDLSVLPKVKDVYITMLPGNDFRHVANKAKELVQSGFNPVPHFPARSIKNLNDLKSKISSYENDLVTLKARTKTANATRKINQHLASVDSKGTVALLERMKNKVEEQESLAQAYGEMAEDTQSVDDEIDKAIGGSSAGDDSLAKLKAKMGM